MTSRITACPAPASLEQIRAVWDAAAAGYSQHVEPIALNVGRYIISLLKPELAERVLECSCGSGSLSCELRRLLRADANMLVTDFSPNMVELARRRLCGLPNTEVGTANACDLQGMADGSFDRYVANLSLMLVPDPDAMLREAFRVLAPGGIAGFSVWGRAGLADSPSHSLLPETLKELGLAPMSTARDNFHLGQDDAALRERVRAAGFGQVVTFHAPAVTEAISASCFIETFLQTATAGAYLKTFGAAVREQVLSAMTAKCSAILASGQAMALDTVVVIAVKGSLRASV